MGIFNFVRPRKQVNASRANESGIPSGHNDIWAPDVSKGQYNVNGTAVNGRDNYTSNWGDSKGYGSHASNAWKPSGNYKSVNSQGSSSSLESPTENDPHKYRLTSYGDD